MTNYILIGICCFILGIITAQLFKKKDDQYPLYGLLSELKTAINDYKNQNEINTHEVKNAIKEAGELAKILTTNQNLKGKFGEDCLEAVIKTCYPQENINYIKQYTTVNADNKKIKPDYLIKLPNNKSILIDCKLNLEKYIEYKENSEEALQKSKKAELIKDLNITVNNLANKKYETAQNIEQADFILMYIPLEPVLTLIYTDSDFISVIKNAHEKNIIIVGNSSILTVIKLVNHLWAKDSQEKNVDEIVNIAQNIYELIAQHSQFLYKIKTQMEENKKNFDNEYKKFTEDNAIFKYAQALREYGIKAKSKKISNKLQESSINADFLN